jgi:ketosteroid isomerase-like protein
VQTSQVTEPVPRAVVEGFYKALAICDMQALASYLDDSVVWTISGPIDILQFCGQHSGKTVVLKLLDRDIPLLLEKRRLNPESMVIDGDRVAVLGKLTARRRDVGHAISYRIAQFFRFRDEKVVEYVSLIDSFDAVEQVLGQPLVRQPCRRAADNDFISV